MRHKQKRRKFAILSAVLIDFAKNTKRNIVANAFSCTIRLLFPFLNRTLFLWLLGPEYLGLNGLFGSILGVLMLAELGFGQAVICSMYKPVAEDNHEQICAYLNFYRTIYRWVGLAIFIIGLALMPFIDKLVHGSVPPDISLQLLYFLHLVNTSSSYFLFAYRGSVLGAYHRSDVVVNIRSAVSIAQYIVVFLILLVTRNYYHYVFATIFFTAVQNVLLVKASRRLFPNIEPHGKLAHDLRSRVISNVRSIFMHKVGGVISNSTDNIVISAFLGLVAVATYGNYYYVVTSVSGIVGIISQSVTGGFGNKIYTKTREDNFKLFMKMVRISLIAVAVCATLMMALYEPFITLWTRGDPRFVRHFLTPLLMVVYFYVNGCRQMLRSFKSAAGIWYADRWKPIVAGAVNLISNIAFVIWLPEPYKLDGVIFSTILGFVFIQLPWETRTVFSLYFSRSQMHVYLREQARMALLTTITCAAALAISRTLLPQEEILQWTKSIFQSLG